MARNVRAGQRGPQREGAGRSRTRPRGGGSGNTGIVVVGVAVVGVGLVYMMSGAQKSGTSTEARRDAARSAGASTAASSGPTARVSRPEPRTSTPVPDRRTRSAQAARSSAGRPPATYPAVDYPADRLERKLKAAFDAYPKLQGNGWNGLEPLDAALEGVAMKRTGSGLGPGCRDTDLERLARLGIGLGADLWLAGRKRGGSAKTRARRRMLPYLSRYEVMELGRLGRLYSEARSRRNPRGLIVVSLQVRDKAMAKLRGEISADHFAVFKELETMRKRNEQRVAADAISGR